jgi:hypothetical protein
VHLSALLSALATMEHRVPPQFSATILHEEATAQLAQQVEAGMLAACSTYSFPQMLVVVETEPRVEEILLRHLLPEHLSPQAVEVVVVQLVAQQRL